jgi:signal transduction histidine kinase
MSGSAPASAAPPEVRTPANPITSSQVEVVLSRATSIFGALSGLQAVPALLKQFPVMDTAAGLTTIVVVFGCLALAGVASVFRQWMTGTFATFAIVYLLTLLLWPTIVPGPLPGDDAAWVYYLCNVATGFAAVAVRRRWWIAAAYTTVTPVVLAALRTLPEGGGASIERAVLDGFYCFFLGAVMLVVAISLRIAARNVDAAQSQALTRYADAVRHNATEAERTRVDALVHDSVLTTLLSAARSRTPETMALSARMARNAMGHLTAAQSSFPIPAAEVPLDVLVGRIRLAVAELSAVFDVHFRDVSGAVPDAAAEALVTAATQAMVNSANHAGDDPEIRRWVRVLGLPDGVSVVVEDTGRGFDPDAIPVERLGVRTSILKRMADAGGTASVVSRPGEGTRVELTWTSARRVPESAPAGRAERWDT